MSRKALKPRELAYLELQAQKGEIAPETISAIKNEKLILEDEPLYVRKQITGGGEIELLTANLDESVGITNIDKRKLPKFVNYIFDALQFGYAKAATTTKTAVNVVYDSIIANVPVALQHANLVIKQNDNPIFTMPIKQLLQQEKLRIAEGDAGYQLKSMRHIKEEVPFQISIKFPDGVTLPPEAGADDHFVEVWIKGVRTRLRGAK